MMPTFPVNLKLKATDSLSRTLGKVHSSLGRLSRVTRKATARFTAMQARTATLRRALKKIGSSMRSAGRSMSMYVTAPILGVGTAILMTAARFEKSMNKVRALTQAGGQAMGQMAKMAKHLGATTKFSASQAADAMAFLGMAGFKTNQILKATPPLLDLAAASNIDLARAADIASNIMGAFGMEAKDVGKISDILAAATASSNVNMEQLADSLKFAGPIARQFGASLEDTVAAVGLLGNVGIQGTLAGTALRTAFLRLSAPTTTAAKLLTQSGVAVADTSGKMRRFADIMTDLGERLGNVSQQKRLQILNELFGRIGITGAATLQQMGKTGVLKRFSNSMKDVEGRARRMADVMNSGATGATIALKSALEGLAIVIAESGLLDFFTDSVKSITKFVRVVSKTNPAMFKLAAIFASILAVIGPLLIAVGAFIAILPGLTTAATALGVSLTFATGGLILIPPAIAAVIAGGVMLVRHWDDVKEAAFGLWLTVKDVFGNIYNWVSEKFGRLLKLVSPLSGFLSSKLGIGFMRKSKEDKLILPLSNFLSSKFSAGLLGDSNVSKASSGTGPLSNITSGGSLGGTQQNFITIDFKNMPSGTNVKSKVAPGTGININTGLQGAMF